MTRQHQAGCNLANLLGTLLVTLLWRAVVAVDTIMAVVVALVDI
jgi:hypothetical protein